MSFVTGKRPQHRDWNLFLRQRRWTQAVPPVFSFPFLFGGIASGAFVTNLTRASDNPPTAFVDETVSGGFSQVFPLYEDSTTAYIWEGGLGFRTSLDGVTWSAVTGSATAFGVGGTPRRAVWNGSAACVAVNSGASRGIYRSTNGTVWTRVSTVTAQGVTWAGGNTWFADTGTAIQRSLDNGVTWIVLPTVVNVSAGQTFNSFTGIWQLGSVLFCGGVTTPTGGATQFDIFWNSVDGGATFTPVYSFASSTVGGSLVATSGTSLVWLVQAGAQFFWYFNGLTWGQVAPPPLPFYLDFYTDVWYHNGTYFAISGEGWVVWSTNDGASWTLQSQLEMQSGRIM